MFEAGQAPGRQRDEAGRDEHGLKPWAPRTDGKRAILVSPRTTVFDRLVPPPAVEAETTAAIADPLWDHRGLTAWTPDLVHCRLLIAGEVVRRLPPVVIGGYRSQLGGLPIGDGTTERRSAPPSPSEITLADWTLDEIAARRWRQILLASAFGFSAAKIAKAMQAKGETVSNRTVQRHYSAERLQLAARWQGLKVAVDQGTAERWTQIFDRREN
jgi:hypothetical protein